LLPPMPCILPSVLTAKLRVLGPRSPAIAAAADLLAWLGPAPPHASSWFSDEYGCWPNTCSSKAWQHFSHS
jgi:hypothetical protein